MREIQKIKVDSEKIKFAIRSSVPLTVTTYTLPHEIEEYITDIVSEYFKQIHQEELIPSVSLILREVLNNAKKANTKRVYFTETGLDINNPADYSKGLKKFKLDTIENIDYYLQKQLNSGLYIKFSIQSSNNKIKLEVRNNSILTEEETERINEKIERSKHYDISDDSLTELLDDSEGAGLGLVIVCLILKKLNVNPGNFSIYCDKGETVTKIILPFTKESTERINDTTQEIINLIQKLPQLPDNIVKINNLINDSKSKMSDIATFISKDVALTTELIKYVNSAKFTLATSCKTINEAVKIVGLKGVRNLLYSIGTINTLSISAQDKQKTLWEHSSRVAFFAYNLARNFCDASERSIIEDSYVCGLLHDMGKIILDVAEPDVSAKIESICNERQIDESMFENMLIGINHAEIGALISKKWKLPETITFVIRYSHSPEDAPRTVKKLAALIYLSDLIDHFTHDEISYSEINEFVLDMFNITSVEQLKGISNKLIYEYNR